MTKDNLKDVITDQQRRPTLKKVIVRTAYTDFEPFKLSQQIIIITGLRRSGKSTFLEQIRQDSVEKNYYLNFDDDRLAHFDLDDFQMLYELFIELYGLQKTFYFDEIQNIPGWERFVRRLHDEGNKIYITGSNASMLSSELGTRLTGRYISIDLYPFSFLEFLRYHDKSHLVTPRLSTADKGALKAAYNSFSELGGLAGYLAFPQKEYLSDIYHSILYRDVIVRNKIGNSKGVKDLGLYLASNLSKECSYNALRPVVGVSSASTVSDYCSYFEDSFLCYFFHRYDYSLKKQIQSPKKVYFVDQALALSIGFRFASDKGRILKNIVFIELKRRGYDIYYHRDKKECDFVIRQGLTVVGAIQVCLDLDETTTRNREFAGLREAMDAYQLNSGLIISLDTFEQHETIKVIPIWRWLIDPPQIY